MTAADMFAQPSSGDMFSANENDGRLCLFENIEEAPGISTVHGNVDAVRADVTVLDAPDGVAEYNHSIVFGSALIPTLRAAIKDGKPLLGRIGQGVAKPGQSPPWLLNEFSAEDAAKAGQYITNRSAGQFAAPAAAPAATAPSAPAQTADPLAGLSEQQKQALAQAGMLPANAEAPF